jgi:hypothetical protein
MLEAGMSMSIISTSLGGTRRGIGEFESGDEGLEKVTLHYIHCLLPSRELKE